MTYGELKEKIRDFGFEDDSTMSEYSTIVKNACNHSIQFVHNAVVKKLEPYYISTMSEDDQEIYLENTPEYIINTTPDGFQITIPDNVVELVPLYAAYLVWLDDDVTKATYYFNSYVQMSEAIIQAYLSVPKGKITGGIGW